MTPDEREPNADVKNGTEGPFSHGSGAAQPTKARNARTSTKPDYKKFCDNNKELIESLLAHNLEWDYVQKSFDQNNPYYYVQGNFMGLTQSLESVFKIFRDRLPAPEYPSKDCLRSLYRGYPLSLFEILRMHYAFEFLRAEFQDVYARIAGDGARQLIPAGSIIPSLRYVRIGALNEFGQACGVKHKDIQAAAEKVLRGPPLPFECVKTLDAGELIKTGKKELHRPYRITDALAIALCAALEGTNDIKALRGTVDRYFPSDPAQIPVFTVAFPKAKGNQIKSFSAQ